MSPSSWRTNRGSWQLRFILEMNKPRFDFEADEVQFSVFSKFLKILGYRYSAWSYSARHHEAEMREWEEKLSSGLFNWSLCKSLMAVHLCTAHLIILTSSHQHRTHTHTLCSHRAQALMRRRSTVSEGFHSWIDTEQQDSVSCCSQWDATRRHLIANIHQPHGEASTGRGTG